MDRYAPRVASARCLGLHLMWRSLGGDGDDVDFVVDDDDDDDRHGDGDGSM